MPRLTAATACVLAGLCCTGCSQLLTARAIDKFSESLAQADVDQLKTRTSERFQEHALRRPEAFSDFKVLNLPAGKTTVLNVEDLSDTEKKVTVKVGEKEQELEYRLTRESGERKWVVDNILVTQAGPGKAKPVTRSVAEQMDLLLTVREFLDGWHAGNREAVLDVTAPDFRNVLAELPPAWLSQLAGELVSEPGARSLQPEARLEKDQAVVLLPQSSGKMLIELKLLDGRWRVSDVAAQSRGDEPIASTRKTAAALVAAAQFLNAYSAGNRDALARWSAPPFYNNAFAAADLSDLPLPVIGLLAAKYEFHRHGERADLRLPHAGLTCMLSVAGSGDAAGDAGRSAADFVVEEVTIYESGSNQAKRMSSLFTSHAVVELFAAALTARDLSRLHLLSTTDFNERAWGRLDAAAFSAVPLWEVEPGQPHVVATVFQGPVAEITVTQGTRALTYVLRSSRGKMLVDDVLMPVTDRPSSLKANLELLAPLYQFAWGVGARDMQRLRRNSSDSLNRIAWAQTESLPELGVSLGEHLLLPLRAVKLQGEQSTILLDDGRRQTRVHLTRETDRFLVQDIELITAPGTGQQITLLSAMRQVIASRNTFTGGVVPAAAELPAGARQPIQPL